MRANNLKWLFSGLHSCQRHWHNHARLIKNFWKQSCISEFNPPSHEDINLTRINYVVLTQRISPLHRRVCHRERPHWAPVYVFVSDTFAPPVTRSLTGGKCKLSDADHLSIHEPSPAKKTLWLTFLARGPSLYVRICLQIQRYRVDPHS